MEIHGEGGTKAAPVDYKPPVQESVERGNKKTINKITL